MSKEKDERPRPNLKLVVNNPDIQRPARKDPGSEYLPLEELVTRQEEFRPLFYQDLERGPTRAYTVIQGFRVKRGGPTVLIPSTAN